MKTLQHKAWALVRTNGLIAYDLSWQTPTPHVYMDKCAALKAQSIDNERIVRVLITITAAKPAKAQRAKRGRK